MGRSVGAATSWREEWFTTHVKHGIIMPSHPIVVAWEFLSTPAPPVKFNSVHVCSMVAALV
jgi:hypothetical protein